MTWDTTTEVQSIVDGADNYGWFISDNEPYNTYNIPNIRFYSKENNEYIPYLEIDFE